MKFLPILAMSAIMLTTGCSTTSNTIDPNSIPTVHVPTVHKMQLRDIDFEVHIINGEPYVVMTTKHYENLALNMQEIKRFILEQKAVIDYYKQRNVAKDPKQ